MSLEISQQTQARLATEAQKAGVSVDALLQRLMDEHAEIVKIGQFNLAAAREAVARIREIRKGVRLDLQGVSIREFAHIGHRF